MTLKSESLRSVRIQVTTLGDLLLLANDRFSNSPALIMPEQQLSYGQLTERALRRARSLQALGVKRGDHVGLLMPTCVEFAECLFAIAFCGAVAVPMNARYKYSELAYVIGNGDLVALDFATGALRWKYTTGNLIGESSPTVAGGTVFIGDLGGVFHAVNIADGKPRWTFKTMSEIKSSPVVVGDTVLIGSYDAHLYALDVATGRQRWAVETQGQVHATPAVVDGLAFIAGCDAVLRAIRVADGTEAYQIASGAYTGASPVIDNGRAYFGTFNNEVLAFDLRAKKRVWRFADPDRKFPFYSSAALANGKVILGGRDKFVYGIDAATGKPAWTFATRARVDSSPAIAGGRVYIGSGDGRLYVLDAATGKKLSEFDAGAGITASPALADGRVIIGTQDGRLYALGD